MKKLFYSFGVAAFALVATACSGNKAETTDSIIDSVADTTVVEEVVNVDSPAQDSPVAEVVEEAAATTQKVTSKVKAKGENVKAEAAQKAANVSKETKEKADAVMKQAEQNVSKGMSDAEEKAKAWADKKKKSAE